MPRVLAPFLLPGSDDPDNPENRCRLPPSQGNYWQTPLFTNTEAMTAYWRVRKWRVDITVSGGVIGSIGCDVEMAVADETQLVCGQSAFESAQTAMAIKDIPGLPVTATLDVSVFSYGIYIYLDYEDFPEAGSSFTEWRTNDFSGSSSNQITLTMGSITKNLLGQFIGDVETQAIASGTMNAVQWWSYDGLYNTQTGELL